MLSLHLCACEKASGVYCTIWWLAAGVFAWSMPLRLGYLLWNYTDCMHLRHFLGSFFMQRMLCEAMDFPAGDESIAVRVL